MLAENPPPSHHAVLLEQFARIGIGPGLDVEDQPKSAQQGRAAAVGTALLRRHFLSGDWATNINGWRIANPALALDLAGDPLFELGNHGTSHCPLSVTGQSAYGIPGTRNPGEVYDEIMTNHARLTHLTGRRPRYFRPGTAYLDEVAAAIVHSLGLIPVGFTINGDAGATFPAATVTREISRARAGDIVIAHGNHPGGGTAPGLAHALKAMKDRGETFLPLPRTTNT